MAPAFNAELYGTAATGHGSEQSSPLDEIPPSYKGISFLQKTYRGSYAIVNVFHVANSTSGLLPKGGACSERFCTQGVKESYTPQQLGSNVIELSELSFWKSIG